MPLPTALPSRVRRPAAALTAGYLAATLPLLLRAAGDGAPALMVGGHLAALGAASWAAVHGGRGVAGTVLDWIPLALIPFLYAELPALMDGASASVVYYDAIVQGWEAAVFVVSPAITMAQAAPWPWASESLHAAYFSYYALIFVPPALLYRQRRHADFAFVCLALMAAFLLCFAVFIFFPVQGPRYLWMDNASPSGPVRGLVLQVLERGSSRGAAFPSSHVAVAVVQAIVGVRLRLRGAWLVVLVTAGLALGAVYGGFHYAVDALAGLLVGAAVAAGALWLRPRVFRGWPADAAVPAPARAPSAS